MTRVSHNKLERVVRRRLEHRLVQTIVALRTSNQGSHFLSELLTETEQIMLAKRLMMIFMLAEGASQYRVKQVLKVSSSTASRTAHMLDRGEFQHLTQICRAKKNRETLYRELEIMVRLGMPSMGKDRWSWLDELYK